MLQLSSVFEIKSWYHLHDPNKNCNLHFHIYLNIFICRKISTAEDLHLDGACGAFGGGNICVNALVPEKAVCTFVSIDNKSFSFSHSSVG